MHKQSGCDKAYEHAKANDPIVCGVARIAKTATPTPALKVGFERRQTPPHLRPRTVPRPQVRRVFDRLDYLAVASRAAVIEITAPGARPHLLSA